MKLLLSSLFFLIVFFGAAQKRGERQKIIDSVYAKKWDAATPNPDSLAVIKITKVDVPQKDTVILPMRDFTSDFAENVPLTPFQLITQKQPKHWYLIGQNDLIVNEAAFSNWNSGGNNNIGVIAKVNYNISYKNGKHFLENIIQLAYGTVAYKGDATRKTDDNINLMSNYGYDIGRDYYFSAGYQFQTQFAAGYNYDATPRPSKKDRISQFMAPGYLNIGAGFSYNPNENLQLIFRPLNGKFTFVTDPFLQIAGRYGLQKDGQSVRAEVGANLNALYRLKIIKGLDFTNQLNLFTNYLYHPERVDIAYNGILNIKFNKFISTVVSIDLLYDHDQIEKLQMKQTLGVMFSYTVGAESMERAKARPKKIIKPFVAG